MMIKIFIFILMLFLLKGDIVEGQGHSGGDDDDDSGPSCDPNNYTISEVCCPSDIYFNPGVNDPGNVVTSCTTPPGCRLLDDACGVNFQSGQICQTVILDNCGICAYAGDTELSCQVTFQASACGIGPPRATALVSTTQIPFPKFATSAGVCIVDDKAAFSEIPTYQYLESVYYTQSKANKATIPDSLSAISDQTVYLKTGDLTIDSNITGTGTAVIFVNGSLTITANNTGVNQQGIVFVVGGDVFIDENVNRIDAVIISQGTICTASTGSPPTCPGGITDPLPFSKQLVVNGSLVNLDRNKPIRFRRNLTNNAQPAEKIVHQVKYLVILKDFFSDTPQQWSEIP